MSGYTRPAFGAPSSFDSLITIGDVLDTWPRTFHGVKEQCVPIGITTLGLKRSQLIVLSCTLRRRCPCLNAVSPPRNIDARRCYEDLSLCTKGIQRCRRQNCVADSRGGCICVHRRSYHAAGLGIKSSSSHGLEQQRYFDVSKYRYLRSRERYNPPIGEERKIAKSRTSACKHRRVH